MDIKGRAPRLEALGFAELEAGGWVRARLRLQESGLGGHIEELWADLGPDSAWLGGKGEAWERGPYYLDGLVPLAFTLGDEAVVARARRWVEAMLASASPEGFFGPPTNLDWWPRTVALKALLSWHEATGDGRVLDLMNRYCAYQDRRLDAEPLSGWAAARGSENALAVLELWRITRDAGLLGLARKCLGQELPWPEIFRSFPYRKPTGAYLPRLPFRAAKALFLALARLAPAKEPLPRSSAAAAAREKGSRFFRTYHFTHNVDYAMAVKRPAVEYALARAEAEARGAPLAPAEDEAARRAAVALADAGIEAALRHHGLPTGIWSGDEHFSGSAPTAGIELCGIVELMRSLEVLLRETGEAKYADRLELLAFNALPAAFTEDMAGHQYLQQANQVLVTRARRPWYDNGPESSLFGLEPEYGCCAANFHQAYPKLARSLWLAAEGGGLALAVYADSRARPRAAGGRLALALRTSYPASGEAEILVEGGPGECADFPLYLRVPAWAEGMTVSVNASEPRPLGPPGTFARLPCEGGWRAGDRVSISIPLAVRIEGRARGAVSVHRGPLLFALAPEESWSSLRGRPPFDYREARPRGPWNRALVLDPADLASSFEPRVEPAPDLLFRRAAPPVSLIARVRRLESWRLRGAQAAYPPASPLDPASPLLGPEEEGRLLPYACARIRLAELPWVGGRAQKAR